jgi:hypothetical protein
MGVSFQDFLRQKSAGTNIQERNRTRTEWLKALRGLLERIEDWLRVADTENLLEIIPHKVQRSEERMGLYDAPALKIRLATDEIDIVPVGRYAIGPLPAQAIKSLIGVKGTDGPTAGRVDVTAGMQ